jgi:molybdopterin synthase catalytic subunit
MNQVTILFFATLKNLAGVKRTNLDLAEGARISDLKAALIERFPGLKNGLPTSLIAINQEFAFDDDLIPGQAEIAIFPPVSGGSAGPILLRVTDEAINLDELVGEITLPTTGAACLFTGMVRGQTLRGDAHETVRLEYEAYIPMAEAKMKQVADEILSRWPAVEGIAMVQRIGELLPGTPTVLIACSAAHRDTGVFEAARYGIDRLKEIVPVWKKEVGSFGEVWVEGKYHPTRED